MHYLHTYVDPIDTFFFYDLEFQLLIAHKYMH